MAGGIEWFRWHHGSVTDPKFQLVARKSGASLPDVLAVWAYLLETASASSERGSYSEIDCESLDCLFGFPSTETRTADILKAMQERDLIDGSRIVQWSKRQPKREREETATSTDRVRKFRAEKRQETPGNANSATETPREEKSREEKKRNTEDTARKRATPPCPDDVVWQVWEDWVALRKAKRAPVTATVVDGARAEAEKAGMPLTQFLRVWCSRGSQGLQADWLKPHERGSPAQQDEPEWRRVQRERNEAFLGPAAARRTTPAGTTGVAEIVDVTSRLVG